MNLDIRKLAMIIAAFFLVHLAFSALMAEGEQSTQRERRQQLLDKIAEN